MLCFMGTHVSMAGPNVHAMSQHVLLRMDTVVPCAAAPACSCVAVAAECVACMDLIACHVTLQAAVAPTILTEAHH